MSHSPQQRYCSRHLYSSPCFTAGSFLLESPYSFWQGRFHGYHMRLIATKHHALPPPSEVPLGCFGYFSDRIFIWSIISHQEFLSTDYEEPGGSRKMSSWKKGGSTIQIPNQPIGFSLRDARLRLFSLSIPYGNHRKSQRFWPNLTSLR